MDARAQVRPRCGRATVDDVSELVEVLARAFDDDPVPNFLFRGDRARHKGLRRFFSIQLRHMYMDAARCGRPQARDRRGAVGTSEDASTGVERAARISFPWCRIWHGSGRRAPDVGRLLAAVDRARPADLHWYSGDARAPTPTHQGHGVGSALVQDDPRAGRRQGLPAYLESSKERESGLLRVATASR